MRHVSRDQLVDLLADGLPKRRIAKLLGYHDHNALNKAMRYRGIRRDWTRGMDAVPIVEVRR